MATVGSRFSSASNGSVPLFPDIQAVPAERLGSTLFRHSSHARWTVTLFRAKTAPNKIKGDTSMRSAVIVSTARTPIGRAYRGAFNDTQSQTLGGHVIAQAVKRAGVAPTEIDDVVMGAALQQGAQGFNLARQSALAAGLPDSVAGMTVDRQCSSGLMAIATAAKQIIDDGMQITVGGGLESISLVQNEHANRHRAKDPTLVERVPALYMAMIETAEIVAEH
jgi:acetyl-CoA C-acetyltransferase